MSKWYRTESEQQGYDDYNQPGKSRYDGDYDYSQGWDDHAREERREEWRLQETRTEQEMEELISRRKELEYRMEEEYYEQQLIDDQPQPINSQKLDGGILWPVLECQCERHNNCICPIEEKCLRAWGYNGYLEPMTPEQRLYCLEEIKKVEGYDYKDYEKLSDSELARSVLVAWTDYCRDKGLI